MSDNSISRKATTAGKALGALSWLVVLVGGVLGALSLWAGFATVEPWVWHGVTIEEEWVSIGLGVVGAAVIAVLFGALWAVLQFAAVAADHLAGKYED